MYLPPRRSSFSQCGQSVYPAYSVWLSIRPSPLASYSMSQPLDSNSDAARTTYPGDLPGLVMSFRTIIPALFPYAGPVRSTLSSLAVTTES